MRCRFRSHTSLEVLDSPAHLINYTHFWCYAPLELGSYNLSLFDENFGRNETATSVQLDQTLSLLELANISSGAESRGPIFRLADPGKTMREWWLIEKDSRDELLIEDKYYYHS